MGGRVPQQDKEQASTDTAPSVGQDHDGGALAMVARLLSGGASAVGEIVALITMSPRDTQAIMKMLHELCGGRFVQEVVEALQTKHAGAPTGVSTTTDSGGGKPVPNAAVDAAPRAQHSFTAPAHLRVTAPSGLHVRSSPTMGDNIVGGLSLDDQIEAVTREGEWIRITFHGQSAYISGDWVEVVAAKPTAAQHDPAVAETQHVPQEHKPTPAPAAVDVAVEHAPPASAPAPAAAQAHEQAPTPAVHAGTPTPVAAPSPAPAPSPAHAAAAPTATATPSEQASSSDPKLLQHAYDKLLAEFDEGKLDQKTVVERFIAFDEQHNHGQISAAGSSMLYGQLLPALAAHEIARINKQLAAHPAAHATPSQPAAPAPPAAHGPAVAPIEPTSDESLVSLAASLASPAVEKVVVGVTKLATDHGAKRDGFGEFTGEARDQLVADVHQIRLDVAAIDKTGLDAKKLGQFVTLVDRKIQQLAPYQYQGYNILTIETQVDKRPDSFYSTCNMTALAMSLEMLGKTAGDYSGDAERINLVAQTFHDDLIADKRGAVHVTGPAHVTPTAATMRLPDFLELAAVAEEMTANTPEAAKAAQAVAKGDKIHQGLLIKLARRFGVSGTPTTIHWGSAELDDKKINSSLGGDFGSQRGAVEGVERDRAHADASGKEADRKKYEHSHEHAEKRMHGKLGGKDVDTALPVDTYSKAVIAQVKPILDSGASFMCGAWMHWIRVYSVTEDGVLIQDPGSWDRHEFLVPWEEARAMGYFWSNLVFR